MFNKKIIILLLLIVSICAISAVSASDDTTDTITSDNGTEVVVADDANVDELKTNFEENSVEKTGEVDGGEILSDSQEDSKLAKDESGETPLGLMFSPSSDDYHVTFKYSSYNLAGSYKDKEIRYYVTPYQTDNIYYYKYDFALRIYDGMSEDANYYYWGNKVFDSGRICGNSITKKTECTITVPGYTFKAGTYYLVMYNYLDNKIMDGPKKLVVKDTGVITVDNYDSFYNSGAPITLRLTDKSTGKGIVGDIKVAFSNGVTKDLTTDSNGYASFVPSFGVGTYTFTVSSNNGNLQADAVQKTATIKKASVAVKAKKVVEYKGFKITLKATVKSNGKDVNEGFVVFKINGKTYKVPVKNGVAIKKLKLKKLKKYKYTAKYLGNANFYKSKASKANAIMKKRQKVKITYNKLVVYTGQVKKVVVKIKSNGKYVKGGWLKIKNAYGVEKVQVKKGKVVLYLVGRLADHYKGTNGIDKYYKKTVNHKYWMKYVPASHKYYAKKVKYNSISKFKCDLCGKKSTHNHYSYGYFVRYTYKIVVS